MRNAPEVVREVGVYHVRVVTEHQPLHLNAQQAVVEVEGLVFRGHPDVVGADLADYFGSIPHTDLLKSVARRIVDRRVLHLIKLWLECPVEETDQRGRTTRTTEARDSRRGIPQGSPLSPLLANLYMRRFVLGWKKLGLEQSLGTRLVNYADDLVILCRRGRAENALHHLRVIMGKLKLTVNEEKTRICTVPDVEFDFLAESGMRQICMSGSMREVWNRSQGGPGKAPPDERGGNRYARPTATAPHLDSTA